MYLYTTLKSLSLVSCPILITFSSLFLASQSLLCFALHIPTAESLSSNSLILVYLLQATALVILAKPFSNQLIVCHDSYATR